MEEIKILVLGLGYVGLPLTLHLGKHFKNVVGFDINETRVLDLTVRHDSNGEYAKEDFSEFKENGGRFTATPSALSEANFIIVTVPTPITESNAPDLRPLEEASKLIGLNIDPSKKPIIVFESTVYPGVTEEVCVPIIEKSSEKFLMECGKDFFVGYSPERVNPGDKVNTIDTITKIVSGMNTPITEVINKVYSSFTKTHIAPSIRVAEAAKVIENSQRDLNIAFVNELVLIFDKLGIDTLDVLEAAGTKWNFLPFRPGLVGGHCISVDPYYLTHKAQIHGFPSQVIAAGRRINDSMAHHVVELVTRGLNSKKKSVNGSQIMIMGATFKANCKDTRNSKIVDVVRELEGLGANCEIYDPFYEGKEIPRFNGKIGSFVGRLYNFNPDLLVYAVDHDMEYKFDHVELLEKMDDPIIVDITGNLGRDENIIRL